MPAPPKFAHERSAALLAPASRDPRKGKRLYCRRRQEALSRGFADRIVVVVDKDRIWDAVKYRLVRLVDEHDGRTEPGIERSGVAVSRRDEYVTVVPVANRRAEDARRVVRKGADEVQIPQMSFSEEPVYAGNVLPPGQACEVCEHKHAKSSLVGHALECSISVGRMVRLFWLNGI